MRPGRICTGTIAATLAACGRDRVATGERDDLQVACVRAYTLPETSP